MKRLLFGLAVILAFLLGYRLNQPRFQVSKRPEVTQSQVPRVVSQQPGISASPAPTPASTPAPTWMPSQTGNRHPQVQEKGLRDLSQKITQMEQAEYARKQRIDDVQRSIVDQQRVIQGLEEEKSNRVNQNLEKYQNQILQNENRQTDLAVTISQLQDQMVSSQNTLRSLKERIDAYSRYGFETDQLDLAQKQYQEESRRYQQIVKNLASAQSQSRQAAATSQVVHNWQQDADQQNLQEQFQPQIERARARLAELENEYQNLQKQDTTQSAKLSQIYQQYDDQRNLSIH
jgi:chromosome segregation ATPase